MLLSVQPAKSYLKEAIGPANRAPSPGGEFGAGLNTPAAGAGVGLPNEEFGAGITPFGGAASLSQAIELFRSTLKTLRTNINPQIKAINSIIKLYEKPLMNLHKQIQSGQMPPGMTPELIEQVSNGLGQVNQMIGSLSQGEQQDVAALQQVQTQVQNILTNVMPSLEAGMQPSVAQGVRQDEGQNSPVGVPTQPQPGEPMGGSAPARTLNQEQAAAATQKGKQQRGGVGNRINNWVRNLGGQPSLASYNGIILTADMGSANRLYGNL